MSKDHGDDRPYKCNQCDSCYPTKGNLTTHVERMHQNKVNFKCDECGKGFYDKTKYDDHCRMHRGIKYECNQCHRSFVEKSGLIKHIERKHEKKRNFKCDECGAKFYDKANFKTHQRI